MLDSLVCEYKKAWNDASIDYQRDYVDVAYRYPAHKSGIENLRKSAQRNNKKLSNAVKKAKNNYERMCKKQNAFIKIADKFNATRVINS